MEQIAQILGLHSFTRGHVEELAVGSCLKGLGPGYLVINDLLLPSGYAKCPTTQIDHVVIHDNAIFVVETKARSGVITGSPSDYNWIQMTARGNYPFRNPVIQNNYHIKALASLLRLPIYQFQSIVVFPAMCSLMNNPPDHVMKTGVVAFIKRRTLLGTKLLDAHVTWQALCDYKKIASHCPIRHASNVRNHLRN